MHPSTLQNVQLWASDGTAAGTVKVLDSLGVSGNGMDFIYACNDRTYYYQSGAVHNLFEFNPTTNTLEVLEEDMLAAPYMDDDNCRFYFSFEDTNAGVEPHYMDMGAPASSLNPPTNLAASTVSRATNKINLTWDDNSANESGFYVERGTDGVSFSVHDSVSNDIETYDDTTGLISSTQYFYRVKAYNSNEPSAYSNIADATTNALAVEDYNLAQIRLYPNPATDFVNVFTPSSAQYLIQTINGDVIIAGKLAQGQNQISLLDTPSGFYIMSVEASAGSKQFRVVIQ